MTLFQKVYPQLALQNKYARANVTRGGVTFSDLTNDDIDVITNLNHLDVQLYKDDVNLFELRWE